VAANTKLRQRLCRHAEFLSEPHAVVSGGAFEGAARNLLNVVAWRLRLGRGYAHATPKIVVELVKVTAGIAV